MNNYPTTHFSRSQSSEQDGDLHANMRINVRFFGPITSIVRRKEDVFNLPRKPDVKISDLLDAMCQRYGDDFTEIAVHNGALNSGLLIGVNGECVMDISNTLGEKDQIILSIASQMKGG